MSFSLFNRLCFKKIQYNTMNTITEELMQSHCYVRSMY